MLQTLSPEQIEKLATCQQPVETLSRQKTMDYLLREVFDADPIALSQPHALIAWLNDYHHRPSPLPELLRFSLVERLKRYPIYRDWEINLLIRDVQALQISSSSNGRNRLSNPYQADSSKKPHLDTMFPLNKILNCKIWYRVWFAVEPFNPLEIADKKGLPNWAHPGVTQVDVRIQRVHNAFGRCRKPFDTHEI